MTFDGTAPGPWVYRTYPSSTPAAAFGPFEPIVSLWRAKHPAPDRFPEWRAFDIMDFEGWWGQLSLAEILDPLDIRWVLWGTRITDWWGIDYTKKRISETNILADIWESQERPYFERLKAERLIGHVSGTLKPQGREFISVRGVDLPLEKDGRVGHVLSAYQVCRPDDPAVPDAEAVAVF